MTYKDDEMLSAAGDEATEIAFLAFRVQDRYAFAFVYRIFCYLHLLRFRFSQTNGDECRSLKKKGVFVASG